MSVKDSVLNSQQSRCEQSSNDAIAIIGMGCIFPDAKNPVEYWINILKKHSAIGVIPKDRWDSAIYYKPDKSAPFTSYSKLCAAVKDFKKDPLKFRIPPVSARFIERAQFMMLEAAYQALADAGYLERSFSSEKTAVFVGTNGKGDMNPLYAAQAHWVKFVQAISSTSEFKNLSIEQQAMLSKAEAIFKENMPVLSEDTCPGIFGSILASRINHCFNLGGTSLVVDASCASSLAAVNLAVKGLREKQYDLVFAGAVDSQLEIMSYILYSSLGALSDKGSFPFDQRADGFVIGEGAGMLLLKRLDDAVRDNDNIYALIRNVGTSSDGRAKGITAPDIKGQLTALQRTYAEVPFSPATISLIEAHGTSTWAGDAAELASLDQFFRKYSFKRRSIALGSVKSMIGHLTSASGMAGIIKVAMALHHRTLPPTMNCEQPRRDFDWEASPLYIINQARPWDQVSGPRRAAVDSFGFGGINYHAILEEAPRERDLGAEPLACCSRKTGSGSEIFVFKACSRSELIQQAEWVRQRSERAAFSEIQGIMPVARNVDTPFILSIVAGSADKFRNLLDKARIVLRDASRDDFFSMQGVYFSARPLAAGEKIAFLFPGSGAQYLNMGNDLASRFAFVQDIFTQIDRLSLAHSNVSMMPLLLAEGVDAASGVLQREEMLSRSAYYRPAILALETGILEVLRRCGLKPDMVAGHSLGEYAALHTAGVLDLSAMIDVTSVRVHAAANDPVENGAMASIGLSAEQVQVILKDLPGFIKIANKNCPAQTVVSGDAQAVEHIINVLRKQGVDCQQLPVRSAYHTSLLDPWVMPSKELFNKVKINQPNIAVQSNLTGQAYRTDDFAGALPDILAQQMVHPVEFISNVESMYAAGARLFIEVGPRATLSSFVDNILGDRPHWCAQTNIVNRSAAEQVLHCLALCMAKGVNVDLSPVRLPISEKVCCPANNMPDETVVSAFPSGEIAQIDPAVKDLVVALVAQKTGFPADVIDIDMDVGSELGLDSIKQLEIIKTIADQLNIDIGKNARLQRYEITTLRKLIDLCGQLRGEPAARALRLEREPELPVGDGALHDWDTDCCRWVSENISRSIGIDLDAARLQGKDVLLVISDRLLAEKFRESLLAAKANVFVCSLSEEPLQLPNNIDIVLNVSSYKYDESPVLTQSDAWWEMIRGRAERLLIIGKQVAALLRRDMNKHVIWVEVTSLGGDLSASGAPMLCSQAGLGLGIMRCLAQEFLPRLTGLSSDFDLQFSDENMIQAVLDELQSDITHKEIGYIQGKRFEIHWRKKTIPQERQGLRLNDQSVVVAIGASRGITASICRQLAQSKARIIIVGKSPLDLAGNEEKEPVLDFQQARRFLLEDHLEKGLTVIPAQIDQMAWEQVWHSERVWNVKNLSTITKVDYHQCDITDSRALEGLIGKIMNQYGKIDLVINGASGLIEKSTEDITGTELINNMQDKALGTACLIRALSKIPLHAFINFSSVAGRWGNKGQSSYAAGHEVAAVLVAAARKQYSGRWVNLFFGPWLNVGMIRAGDVVERLKAKGSSFITHETGSSFFMREFDSTDNCNVAFCGRKSIWTIDQEEDVRGLFTKFFDHHQIEQILGYKKDLYIVQVSIEAVKSAFAHRPEEKLSGILSAEEHARYVGLKCEKRGWEWLSGRLAVKAAVNKYFNNGLPGLSAVIVYNLPNGSPAVVFNGIDTDAAVPRVSISHSGDVALALALQDPKTAIDVQRIDPSILEIADAFCSRDESDMLVQTGMFDREFSMTVVWSVKEAARKAAGVELCSMKELEIKKIQRQEGYVVTDLFSPETGWMKAAALKQGEYVIAVSRAG